VIGFFVMLAVIGFHPGPEAKGSAGPAAASQATK
jgi:hypothetical protein